MKLRHLQKQSGVALIAVMFVIALAMMVMPSIMSRSSFVQGLGAKQLLQLKNTIKAEEVNNMLHGIVFNQPTGDVEAGFSSSTMEFDCEQRVLPLDNCQVTVSKKKLLGGVEVYRCLSSTAEVDRHQVVTMRHVVCVYGPGTSDVAISDWKYQKAAKFVKVEEQAF